jgi:Arc/MetJ family transcription regulator
MIRRTTVDLDHDLLARAREALGCDTARATIHEALRRVLDEGELGSRAAARESYFTLLEGWVDLDLLQSDAAWR